MLRIATLAAAVCAPASPALLSAQDEVALTGKERVAQLTVTRDDPDANRIEATNKADKNPGEIIEFQYGPDTVWIKQTSRRTLDEFKDGMFILAVGKLSDDGGALDVRTMGIISFEGHPKGDGSRHGEDDEDGLFGTLRIRDGGKHFLESDSGSVELITSPRTKYSRRDIVPEKPPLDPGKSLRVWHQNRFIRVGIFSER